MPWLLDTNVVSEFQRPNPTYRVLAFLDTLAREDLFLSAVTFAEIRFGIDRAFEPRKSELSAWLTNELRLNFAGRILPVTEDIMLRWRHLVHTDRKSGRTHPEPDLLLAATALHHRLTLVTRNVRDFAGLDLPILNPWDTP